MSVSKLSGSEPEALISLLSGRLTLDSSGLLRRNTSRFGPLARPGSAGTVTGERELTVMSGESRIERRFETMLARAKTVRGAVVVIASISTTITVVAGVLMTAVHHNFPSIGAGLWWAVQTVTTVGYGDLVPVTVLGRLLAALVMLAGIGFLTVITAAITSSFVSRSRLEQSSSKNAVTADELHEINGRLERIEAALAGRASPS
jgi:voltage-gated potassium channel